MKKILKKCFYYRGKYWFKNIKNIPLFFYLVGYRLKYGYDEFATWDIFSWFIDNMREILIKYNKSRVSYPAAMSSKEWRQTVNKMIDLLNEMDENNPKYEGMEYINSFSAQDIAKKEFFKLFSKYFYYLWD